MALNTNVLLYSEKDYWQTATLKNQQQDYFGDHKLSFFDTKEEANKGIESWLNLLKYETTQIKTSEIVQSETFSNHNLRIKKVTDIRKDDSIHIRYHLQRKTILQYWYTAGQNDTKTGYQTTSYQLFLYKLSEAQEALDKWKTKLSTKKEIVSTRTIEL
jgi:hypothetical protein